MKKTRNPAQEIRELMSYGVARVTLRFSQIPEAWRPVIELELKNNNYALESDHKGIRIYKRKAPQGSNKSKLTDYTMIRKESQMYIKDNYDLYDQKEREDEEWLSGVWQISAGGDG